MSRSMPTGFAMCIWNPAASASSRSWSRARAVSARAGTIPDPATPSALSLRMNA